MAQPLWRRLVAIAGPAGALALHLLGDGDPRLSVAGVAFWVALWWVTEALPIAATSLLPVVLLPLFGVAGSGAIADAYMDRFIMLMMAGFMAALAIERWQLHRRVALRCLLLIGASPRRLLLGMLVVTALSSAWIANTAATLIMLPIGLALTARLGAGGTFSDKAQARTFATLLCLAIAYGASIGGMLTPIGTPTNLIYLGAVDRATGQAPGFIAWMGMAAPIVALMLGLTYATFRRRLGPLPRLETSTSREDLRAELDGLGPLRGAEARVAWIFGAMVLLWIGRDIDLGGLGGGARGGWAVWLGLDHLVDDATVAVAGMLALVMVRAPAPDGRRLLDWETAKQIPWEVVLLFGGGLALARGFDLSGLSATLGASLEGVGAWPPLAIIAALALVVTFTTEVTSNTAITTLLMPILAPVALASGLGPEVLMLPAAMAANCAFMLPVATPPNAVVYGMGHVRMGDMARTGLRLNLLGVGVITAVLGLRHLL